MAEDVHASKEGRLLAADITLIILSGTAVALRLLSRRLSRVGLWYDDYVIMIALLLAWMLPVLNFIGWSLFCGQKKEGLWTESLIKLG